MKTDGQVFAAKIDVATVLIGEMSAQRFSVSVISIPDSWGFELSSYQDRRLESNCDGRLPGFIIIASTNDIAVHQVTIDADDVYNVFPFCIIVNGLIESVNLPLESQDSVDATSTLKSTW